MLVINQQASKENSLPNIRQSKKKELRTVPSKLWFFISKFEMDVVKEDIMDYLNDYKKDIYIVEDIIAKDLQRNRTYKSFKVGLPLSMKEVASSEEFWPKGCFVNRFYFSRNPARNSQASSAFL